jgi:hypothetical protein
MGELLVHGHAEGRLPPTHAVLDVVVRARDVESQEAAMRLAAVAVDVTVEVALDWVDKPVGNPGTAMIGSGGRSACGGGHEHEGRVAVERLVGLVVGDGGIGSGVAGRRVASHVAVRPEAVRW